MTSLTALGTRLRRGAQVVVALLLGSMFATFILQIIFRYLFNNPLGWSVEYVAIAWLWGILFGYAFVIEDRDIIRLDIVYGAVSPQTQRAMQVVGGLVIAGLMLGSLPAVWGYVTFMKVERTAFLHVPFDLVFSIYIPFVLSVSLRALIDVWHGMRGTGRHATPAEHAMEALND